MAGTDCRMLPSSWWPAGCLMHPTVSNMKQQQESQHRICASLCVVKGIVHFPRKREAAMYLLLKTVMEQSQIRLLNVCLAAYQCVGLAEGIKQTSG